MSVHRYKVGEQLKFGKMVDPGFRRISGWPVPLTGTVLHILKRHESQTNPEIAFYKVTWPGINSFLGFTYVREEELESLKPKRNLPDWF